MARASPARRLKWMPRWRRRWRRSSVARARTRSLRRKGGLALGGARPAGPNDSRGRTGPSDSKSRRKRLRLLHNRAVRWASADASPGFSNAMNLLAVSSSWFGTSASNAAKLRQPVATGRGRDARLHVRGCRCERRRGPDRPSAGKRRVLQIDRLNNLSANSLVRVQHGPAPKPFQVISTVFKVIMALAILGWFFYVISHILGVG